MLEKKILKVTTPTIAIDTIETIDTDDENSPIQSSDRKHRQLGQLFPQVQINKYKFSENEIDSFYLDLTGYVPTCRVSVVSADGIFLSKSYPKDGDPMSIFIRSKMNEFKPIRADFDITSVNSIPSQDSDGNVVSYTIEGFLRVPKLYAEFCKSFKNKSSFDTLIDVANDMGLGFASNETTTDDKMTWLCSFDTYAKFTNEVTKASYKDDDSFFSVFIDHYYYMNFVNVNNQFGEEFELENAIESLSMSRDYFNKDEISKFETSLMLCNHKNLRGTGNYIAGYTLINSCGQVVKDNGYRRFVQFYDNLFETEKPEDKYKSYFIEPLNTKGTNDKILLKGRTKEPEIFKNTNRHKFMGMQMGLPKGNVHQNYLHALLNNWQNEQEIKKMQLVVRLTKCNFNLYRGQRIPVLILNQGDRRAQMTQQPEQSESEKLSYDKFLSGYYFIIGMKIMWSATDVVFYQELNLARREWPIPVQEPENIAQG